MTYRLSNMAHFAVAASMLSLLCLPRVTVFSFSCVCSPSECEEISEEDCPAGGGTVWDACNCCRVCAKIEGEPCGGPYGFHGTCAKGLACVISSFASGKPILDANSEGICTKHPGSSNLKQCRMASHGFGCNIIDNQCECERAYFCAEESPFMFSTTDECQVNLAVMLQQERIPPANISGYSGNCSNGNCDDSEEDDSKCPADSSVDQNEDGCVCKSSNCYKPSCRAPDQLILKRKGSNVPGDCCDVYQCVSPHDKNCSQIICPEEMESCPEDSYLLKSYSSPEECCSTRQVCQCLPGTCKQLSCTSGQHPKMIHPGNNKPGTCCPLFVCVPEQKTNDSCLVDGSKLMANGSSWQKDECTVCSCINGLQFCKASGGSHCDENRGCMSSSRALYKNGESWLEDSCTQCTCESGEKKCVAFMCQVSCANPRYVPGECCPLCDDSSIVKHPSHCPNLSCSLRCVHGFVRDEAGCFTCACEAGKCLLECPNGFAHDDKGHLLCECADARESSSSNKSSSECPSAEQCRVLCSQGGTGCDSCQCRNDFCTRSSPCDKICPGGYSSDDRGCPLCECLELKDKSEGTAKKCTTAQGETRFHGESWHDGCRHCLCHDGIEMCNLIICPRLNCINPVFNSSADCCATCPDDSSEGASTVKTVMCQSLDGSYKKEGETWPVNKCTTCICHNGQTLCDTRQCPPAACPFPLPDEDGCCPQCPPEPSRESEESQGWHCGFSHPHGAVWRRGNCESCKCDNGKVICFTQQCHPEKCRHPVMQKNQCCGMCIENEFEKWCRLGNKTYRNSEEWIEDECTRCRCIEGRSTCTREVCASLNCDNGIRSPGSCCPFCPGARGEEVFGLSKGPVKMLVYYVIITVLVLVIVSLVVSILILCKRSRRYCVSCPDSESLPSFKTLSKPKFKYSSSDCDYTTEKEKLAIV